MSVKCPTRTPPMSVKDPAGSGGAGWLVTAMAAGAPEPIAVAPILTRKRRREAVGVRMPTILRARRRYRSAMSMLYKGAMPPRGLDLIAFDGDDTLWHNERSYREGRERFRQLLARARVALSEEEMDRQFPAIRCPPRRRGRRMGGPHSGRPELVARTCRRAAARERPLLRSDGARTSAGRHRNARQECGAKFGVAQPLSRDAADGANLKPSARRQDGISLRDPLIGRPEKRRGDSVRFRCRGGHGCCHIRA